jgi:MFS family permease
VSVPIGLAGTIWAYKSLREVPRRAAARIDWPGNLTFALGLVSIMVGVTWGIQPAGGHVMGWTSPKVLTCIAVGIVLLATFVAVERKAPDPMFRLELFKIRAFTAGSISTFLASVGRGGLMFILVIWLQGIWLPSHGYDFTQTPLWAGIYMLPLTVGFLTAGPISGYLSDRIGARYLATGGMLAAAASFFALGSLPVDFQYPVFALVLLFNGLAMGAFAAPNRAAVMDSLPPAHRGVGSGMNSTFQNSAQVLSIGIFFTLMIVGLAAQLPTTLFAGLVAHGVPAVQAHRVASLPPVSILFAAFLGYDPIAHLLGPTVLAALPPGQAQILTGREFFPSLIAAPFRDGLHAAFAFAIIACLVAAAMSWARGGQYRHGDAEPAVAP